MRPARALLAALFLAAAAAPAAPSTTAPAPALRFAVKGDWGWGGPDQAAVTRRMCVEQARAPFAFVLTTGDNFYRPDGEATAANWSRPEACLIAAGVPWRAAWGNHDEGREGTATALGARRHWYTFASGPARIVVLDANQPSDPGQTAFLRRTLAAAREPALIVAFHQPAYTAGPHMPGLEQQREWVPLFHRYRVSLVLQGHNHDYERLRAGGVTYITTGGGGAPLYPCERRPPELVTCRSAHHFLVVTVTDRAVDVRAERSDGSLLERVRLPVRGRAGP
jgi:tartrate-resistant acid phosphatase type 5